MENQNASTNNSTENNSTASTVDYVSYENPPPAKRGRAYAPMGEFDLSLIREFRACPALYDRNSSSFRDKLHTAHQWQEISNKLGFDVSLLKDRMLQLRNRYNLEKRRLEQIRDENPGQHVDSPWPLFDHLHFLSEHIRPRRSYRSMLPRNSSHIDTGDDEDDNTQQQRRRQQHYAAAGGRDSLSDGGGGGGDGDGGDSGCGIGNNISADMTSYANGILTVKMEEPDGDTNANASDAESGSQSGNEDVNNTNPLKLSATSTLLTIQKRQPHSMSLFNKSTVSSMAIKNRSLKYSASSAVPAPPAAIKIRRLDTMQERSASGAAQLQSRANIPDNNNHIHNTTNNDNSRSVDRRNNRDCTLPTSRPNFNMQVNRRCLTNSEQKYAAFGEFVTASLLELPAGRALQLVEKFTTEVVRVLLDSKTESVHGGVGQSGVVQQAQLQSQQLTQPFTQINGGVIGETVNGI